MIVRAISGLSVALPKRKFLLSLSLMKITDIKIYLLRKKLSSSMTISRGGFNVRTHAIVEVHTDEGISGLGEGVGDAILVSAIVDKRMRESAIGLNPMEIEHVREKLMDGQVYFESKGSGICAASAIEMACWDIKGKALNVPVYQLLGGLYQDSLEAYVSDVYWEEDPRKMAKNAERILGKGFKTIKAHIGHRSPREDLGRVKALRETAGEATRLMLDLNAGYDAMQAREAMRLWKKFDLYWIEEPVSPYHLDILADLRARADIPIAAGENEFRVKGFKELFDKKAVDIAMPDIGRVGGIQETKNICALAAAYGVAVSPHNFSSGILLAATIHLMASTPNTTLLEFDTSENAIYQELLTDPLVLNDGCVMVPSSPGLGVHLPKQVIDKYAVS